jgi:hypothetical protein
MVVGKQLPGAACSNELVGTKCESDKKCKARSATGKAFRAFLEFRCYFLPQSGQA